MNFFHIVAETLERRHCQVSLSKQNFNIAVALLILLRGLEGEEIKGNRFPPVLWPPLPFHANRTNLRKEKQRGSFCIRRREHGGEGGQKRGFIRRNLEEERFDKN